VGVGLAFSQSLLYQAFPPIPYKWIPDLRLPVLFLIVFLFTLWSAFGEAPRRVASLWFVIALVFVAGLDLVSIHWLFPIEGTLSGERVDVFRVGGMVLSISAILLLHADSSAVTLREALLVRGAPREDAERAHALLWQGALRRVGAVGAAFVALGLVLFAIEKGLGDAKWGSTTAALAAGLGLLVLGTAFLVLSLRATRRAR